MIIRPPAAGGIGARVTDVDVRALRSEEAAALKAAVYQHKLVVLEEQRPSAEEYIAFARQLGRVQVYFQDNYHHPDHPEIFVSSNVPENGKKVGVAGTGQYWHTDYQFSLEPLSTTLVYPQILPDSRRETYYIDMVRVYRELPPQLRRALDGRRAVAEGKWRYKVTPADIDRALVDLLNEIERLVPPVSHPAVIQHPVTAELALYLSSGFSTGFEGLSFEVNRRMLV
jgi:taurine dioxygenase